MFTRYPLQIAAGLFIFFILTVPATTYGLQAVTPQSIVLKVFQDGVASVDYRVSVDQNAPRITIALIGGNYENLVVTGASGRPLDFKLDRNVVAVDTLGESTVTVTYTAQGIASVSGAVWTMVLDSPAPLKATFPEGATVVSVNQPPLDVAADKATTLTMPAGHTEISYTLATVAVSQNAPSSSASASSSSQAPAGSSIQQPSTGSPSTSRQQGSLQLVLVLVGIVVIAAIAGVVISRRRKQSPATR